MPGPGAPKFYYISCETSLHEKVTKRVFACGTVKVPQKKLSYCYFNAEVVLIEIKQ